jgi:hypothetical protein
MFRTFFAISDLIQSDAESIIFGIAVVEYECSFFTRKSHLLYHQVQVHHILCLTNQTEIPVRIINIISMGLHMKNIAIKIYKIMCS